jgi:RNA polymerase sigma-70 factor (sigma-E family)
MDELATAAPPEDRTDLATVSARDHDRLVRLAWLLTSSPETAHDVVQDAFAAAHRRWDVVRDPAAYLRRSVVNGAAQHHRRRHRDLAVMRRHGPADTATSPEDEYLADAIAALPFRQQAVVVLRFWGGLSEADIAAAVGCRPGTVGPTLTRALRRLRTALTEIDEVPAAPEEDR